MNIHQIIECFYPSSVTFEIRFCLFHTWWFTRFTNDLDSTDNSNSASSFPMTNCCGLASLWESTSGPRSFTRCYLTHNGLRGSIMLSFLMRETRLRFSCRSPRSYIGSPRSFAHLSISFPLLRRPSMVIIPLWVACWGKAFHKIFMIIVVEWGLLVAADIGSPRSLLFLSSCTPGILISITSLHQAYWTRGWSVRRLPCNKIAILLWLVLLLNLVEVFSPLFRSKL